MNTLLIRHPVSLKQLKQLQDEAVGLSVLDLSDDVVSDEDWSHVEILYGPLLSAEELQLAQQLRWIHVPYQDASGICLEEVRARGSTLVTVTPEPNARQISETVMGAVLSFAKLLFFWHDGAHEGMSLWSSPQRAAVWGMENKIFLQIGLGTVGSAIAKGARDLGMRVMGTEHRHRFHPDCHKTVRERDLHSCLPAADVVSICVPSCRHYHHFIGEAELGLMKDDSVLCVVGAAGSVDEQALAAKLEAGKFRGVFLDNAAPDSVLRTSPRALVTPRIANLPHGDIDMAFRQLRHNLRHFLHSDYHEMRQMLDWSLY